MSFIQEEFDDVVSGLRKGKEMVSIQATCARKLMDAADIDGNVWQYDERFEA